MGSPRRPSVLLVDDNPRVRSFVRPALEEAGYDCLEAEDGWTALDLIETESPDLVVLDIMLGDERMNGLDVCKKMRDRGFRTPVVFLTIRDRVDDPDYMERAFQLGGDDYVSKREELRRIEEHMGLAPTEFLERKSDIEELIARVKARLPRVESQIVELDDYLRVDLATKQAQINDGGRWVEVHLALKEFDVLQTLIRGEGKPVGKGELIHAAELDGEGSLQTHIWKLRQKLEPDPQKPRYIVTYHRIGYRFRRAD